MIFTKLYLNTVKEDVCRWEKFLTGSEYFSREATDSVSENNIEGTKRSKVESLVIFSFCATDTDI